MAQTAFLERTEKTDRQVISTLLMQIIQQVRWILVYQMAQGSLILDSIQTSRLPTVLTLKSTPGPKLRVNRGRKGYKDYKDRRGSRGFPENQEKTEHKGHRGQLVKMGKRRISILNILPMLMEILCRKPRPRILVHT